MRLRVTSECGGGPVAAAVCGWGSKDPKTREWQIRVVVAGPAGVDGVVALDAAVATAATSGALVPESLMISAPGYETKPIEIAPDAGPSLVPVEVSLAKETRIIGEMTWPATWMGHVRGQNVNVGVAPAKEGEPWTAGSLTLEPDGRSFHGLVRGCGRYWVIFHYFLDDREGAAKAILEIDARTSSEVHVPMLPDPAARQPEAAPTFPWTLEVMNAEREPLEGAVVKATRQYETWLGPLPGSWTTNAAGEAVREVPAGTYHFTVSKPGWGTAYGSAAVTGPRRDTVRMAPARTTLVVNVTRTAPVGGDALFVQLRQRAEPGDPWTWRDLETRGTMKAADRFEFRVADGHEYAVYASGRGLAPVAERISKVGPEEHERIVEVEIGPGETVEVRGLEGELTTSPIPVQIQYEGLLGEILTATPEARFREGKWVIEHLTKGAGEVSARVGGRHVRGRLPALGGEERRIELR